MVDKQAHHVHTAASRNIVKDRRPPVTGVQASSVSVLHQQHPCLNLFNPGEDFVIAIDMHEEPHRMPTFHRREVSQLRFVRGPTTAATKFASLGSFQATNLHC